MINAKAATVMEIAKLIYKQKTLEVTIESNVLFHVIYR